MTAFRRTPPASAAPRWIPARWLAPAALGLLACACSPASQNQQQGGTSDPKGLRHTLELEAAAVPDNLGQRAYDHCAQVVSFGERYVGSPGWDNAITYIRRELKALDLNPISDRWGVEGEKLTFHNVHVTIPGASPDRIVIGCHHDTKCTQGHPDPEHNYRFVGANDSGSGVGLLLALAEVLSQRENAATYQLVWFDGEESIPYKWDHKRSLFGSRRFVSQYLERQITGLDASRIRAFVLLDMVGRADLHIDEVTNTDPLLRDIAYAAARACGEEEHFFEYKWDVTDDHVPFFDEQIPTVNLLDLKYNAEWHTAEDTLEHISAESLHTVGSVVLTMLPEIERRFLTPKAPIKIR